MTTATVENLEGRYERVALPQPIWAGAIDTSVGITLEAIYRGPRTGRMFARYYSIWQRNDGTGGRVGTTYPELTADEYLQVCRLADVEPVGVQSEAA